MFIKNDAVADWKDLQNKVAQLFGELVCNVETPRIVELAGRGKKEIDVYVTDERSSISKVTLVECKLWKNEIPQEVVHGFHTVMQGCGANTGFIISKVGFQAGAQEAAQHTNIVLLTFEELQHRFGNEWFSSQNAEVGVLLKPLRQAAQLHFDQFNTLPIPNNMVFHTAQLQDRLWLLLVWNSVLLCQGGSIWPESYLGSEPVKMARDPLKPFSELAGALLWHEAATVRSYFHLFKKALRSWNIAFQHLSASARKSFDALAPDEQSRLMGRSLAQMHEELPLRVLKGKITDDEYQRLLGLI